MQQIAGQIADLVSRDLPVALQVADLGARTEAPDAFANFCDRLGVYLTAADCEPGRLDLTVSCNNLSPAEAWRCRESLLGPGVLNLLPDAAQFGSARFFWQLWNLRHLPQVRLAFWPVVSSPSPLLSSEPAAALLPGCGLQVPAQSAWVLSRVDVSRFADRHGGLDKPQLGEQLATIVTACEAVHEKTRWPTPQMRQDAWLNRRIAIRLAGLGDYAGQQGLDPGHRATFGRLQDIVDFVRGELRELSRRCADRNETLPAIAASSPCGRLAGVAGKQAWERRWLRAVRQSAIRHRNLLVMSPWSLFPGRYADFRYLDLLPLLAAADACEFQRECSVAHWNVNKFISFHRRAWAVQRRVIADCVVAE